MVFSHPGSAWVRTACEALPRGSYKREAEPPEQCVPRQSLGTRRAGFLAPRLCLGADCPRGSASRIIQTGGRASRAVRSQAEPGNEKSWVSRTQALPGSGLPARLCLADHTNGRQSLQSSAFPGRAWEREELGFSHPGSAWERTAREALPRGSYKREAEPPEQCVPRQSLGTRRAGFLAPRLCLGADCP